MTGPDRRPDAPAGTPTAGEWERLREAATAAMRSAYAPYSRYPVGAAALTEDGRLVTGCNVENASYGLGLCAECTLVGQLLLSGGGRLRAFHCVDGEGRVLVPCGRCRQLLYEHRGAVLHLMTPAGVRTIDEVLPDAFGPQHLRDAAGAPRAVPDQEGTP